jgi:hypothetical protein
VHDTGKRESEAEPRDQTRRHFRPAPADQGESAGDRQAHDRQWRRPLRDARDRTERSAEQSERAAAADPRAPSKSEDFGGIAVAKGMMGKSMEGVCS